MDCLVRLSCHPYKGFCQHQLDAVRGRNTFGVATCTSGVATSGVATCTSSVATSGVDTFGVATFSVATSSVASTTWSTRGSMRELEPFKNHTLLLHHVIVLSNEVKTYDEKLENLYQRFVSEPDTS